jgi:septal ring factor EnvC (AmiA/AmiB activator)
MDTIERSAQLKSQIADLEEKLATTYKKEMPTTAQMYEFTVDEERYSREISDLQKQLSDLKPPDRRNPSS